MCSHLSKSVEPKNWYYSFGGSFFLSTLTLHISLALPLALSVFAHPWMRKSDYLRKNGVCTLVKDGSLVSAVSVKRLLLHLRTSPYCLTPTLDLNVTTHAHTSLHNKPAICWGALQVLTAKTIHALHLPKLIAWKQCFIAAHTTITTLLKISGWKAGEQHNA